MKDSTTQIYLIPSIISPNTQNKVLSPQIVEIISVLDYYLVENVRTARRFISSLKIKEVSGLHFETIDGNISEQELHDLCKPAKQGISIGVISEAGCPSVADPGSRIVLWAHRNHIKVTPLVGPSSILLALMGSGMNGQQFEFHGYLPIDKPSRVKKIKAMETESAKTGKTQIFMETPYRNQGLAEVVIKHCRPHTLLCLACDLTAATELIQTKSIGDWKHKLPDLHKRPALFLLQVTKGHI